MVFHSIIAKGFILKTYFIFDVVVQAAICEMGTHHKPFNVLYVCASGVGVFGPFYHLLHEYFIKSKT